MFNTINPNCDGDHCRSTIGEVRVLPTGGSANALLCYDCYLHELTYRRERNKELGTAFQFALPAWKDLKIYNNE